MNARLHPGMLAATWLFAGLVAQPTLAQRGTGQGKARANKPVQDELSPPRDRKPESRPPRDAARRGAPAFRREAMPPRWMERLRQMPPEQQERFMTNNERFRMLPTERQAEIRENLRRWNGLGPEQQRAFREREEVWQRMSPDQRRHVREEIMPRWQQLEPARRQALMRRLRVLRDLNEEQRAARLADEGFMTGLSAEDQELLRELSRLRIGPPPERGEPGPENPPS